MLSKYLNLASLLHIFIGFLWVYKHMDVKNRAISIAAELVHLRENFKQKFSWISNIVIFKYRSDNLFKMKRL